MIHSNAKLADLEEGSSSIEIPIYNKLLNAPNSSYSKLEAGFMIIIIMNQYLSSKVDIIIINNIYYV